jgi:hypothetical protein
MAGLGKNQIKQIFERGGKTEFANAIGHSF